jgi:hypothetical protein
MRQDDTAQLGMVDPLQPPAREHVLVVHDLIEIAHRRAGHLRRQHAPRRFVLGHRLRPAFDRLVDGGEVLDSRRTRDEARIFLEIGSARDVEYRVQDSPGRRQAGVWTARAEG